ncbi:uncharacterized protein LOC103957777 isoform X4 [Pyrus x bretschneideri]|uniref:uncharacterized protein LOC103957777 isoform X4 n=1 Tax=Pyrus x bretschneideri TaxID=225117 RepID=UPI0020301D5D|nr:uncharacterized protein LOC103957777 isoform X4 [Pyrus x bretschneideri]
MAGIMDLMKVILMILAANAAVGVITETNTEKALEVLICRLMDRPLCPTMCSGFYHETQILSWDKEEDKELDPGCALLRPSCVCMSSFKDDSSNVSMVPEMRLQGYVHSVYQQHFYAFDSDTWICSNLCDKHYCEATTICEYLHTCLPQNWIVYDPTLNDSPHGCSTSPRSPLTTTDDIWMCPVVFSFGSSNHLILVSGVLCLMRPFFIVLKGVSLVTPFRCFNFNF